MVAPMRAGGVRGCGARADGRAGGAGATIAGAPEVGSIVAMTGPSRNV